MFAALWAFLAMYFFFWGGVRLFIRHFVGSCIYIFEKMCVHFFMVPFIVCCSFHCVFHLCSTSSRKCDSTYHVCQEKTAVAVL